jgi:NAD(P)-dependent dehydrogenase (short-subunit alcohol dehydrogenase family)
MAAWHDQVALVTGGARGIGRATARLLAQRGAAICVNYAAHADAADELVKEILADGGRAISDRCRRSVSGRGDGRPRRRAIGTCENPGEQRGCGVVGHARHLRPGGSRARAASQC